MNARHAAALLALLALAPATPGAGQVLQPRIANGVTTTDRPTTGALLFGSTDAMICSGTMIGCNTFLTAAHCVCDEDGSTCDPTEGDYRVFLQHAGIFGVVAITPNPTFIDFPAAENDIAIVTLGSPMSGIAPTPLASSPPPFGSAGTIAGFGTVDDDPRTGSGLKREGAVTTTDCTAESGAPNSQYVCWDPDPPFGPPGTDSNTCPGDSGGPLFTQQGGETVVSGAISFGLEPCAGDDFSGAANVATYASWIAGVAGADVSQTSCGTLPQVGDGAVQVSGFEGELADGSDENLHSFEVPAGTSELRVTLNGIDDGFEDFDLWVRYGAVPEAGLNDCSSESFSQFETCAFASPTAGTWYALARSVGGGGPYQVTATAFGQPPACGNGVIESGEGCDDGNTLAGDGCDALCRIEADCGDGVVEGAETCDDGNTLAGDGCDALCRIEADCGDGVVEGAETCDDGNTLAGDGCDALCRIEADCGDGVVEGAETCDDGNTRAGDGCDALCQTEAVCGNGVVETGEICDDGNTLPGDGCDASCGQELGCPAMPAPTCERLSAGSTKLKLRRGSKPGKDRLQWTWSPRKQRGVEPDLGALADTDYRLCIYEAANGVPGLALDADAPAGPQWTAKPSGFRFAGGGVAGDLEQLKIGTKRRIKLAARAREIPALPLAQESEVVVQLQNDLGRCWESRYAAPAKKSDDRRFFDSLKLR